MVTKRCELAFFTLHNARGARPAVPVWAGADQQANTRLVTAEGR